MNTCRDARPRGCFGYILSSGNGEQASVQLAYGFVAVRLIAFNSFDAIGLGRCTIFVDQIFDYSILLGENVAARPRLRYPSSSGSIRHLRTGQTDFKEILLKCDIHSEFKSNPYEA